MEYIHSFIDLILHMDKHLDALVAANGPWIYAILAGIVFCETGLVVTPFLPGDSLLFAAGAIAARGGMNIWLLCALLFAAAVAGDAVNYFIGKFFGERLSKSRWIKEEHLKKTHDFYERYGGKTIIIARFVPIVRTFAPFVAGMGQMTYSKFSVYNVLGGFLWVLGLAGAGFVFGEHPFVKSNFGMIVLGIITVSLMPIAFELIKIRLDRAKAAPIKNA